ncbi:MAG: hypothetical protein ABEN55_04095, partial [Bradymonadaceae bacterium]
PHVASYQVHAMASSRSKAVDIGFLIVICLGFVWVIGVSCGRSVVAITHQSKTEAQKVKRIDRSSSKRTPYIVYTESGDVYQVSDRWVLGHVTASNVAASISEGACYRFDIEGFRVPLLSWYPNVLDVHPVDCPSNDTD